MDLFFSSKSFRRAVIAWIAAGLIIGTATGCHLLKMQPKKPKPTEFSCGEPCPPVVR